MTGDVTRLHSNYGMRFLKALLALLATAAGCERSPATHVATNGMVFADATGFTSEFGAAIRAEDYQTAEQIGRNATELDPHKPSSWTMLSIALLQQAKFEPAITAAERAIELDPNSTQLHYNRGLISQLQGDALHGQERHVEAFEHFGVAIVWYQRARALDPDDPMVYFGLAACYEGLGNDDYVISNAKRFLELAPDDPSAGNARDMIRVATDFKQQEGG